MSIKIYLDDELQYRVTPDGYIRFTTGEELISYVESYLNSAIKVGFSDIKLKRS